MNRHRSPAGSSDVRRSQGPPGRRSPGRLRDASLFALASLAFWGPPLRAQTIDDSLMMPRNQLCTGFIYMRDGWTDYWEGSLQRANGNIGTITTQSVSWVGNYGISDRLNVIAMLPYVWTHASQGVLSDMDGLQDATLALKYDLLGSRPLGGGSLRAFAVAAGSAPASAYTPDFYPLSIGSASPRLSGRLTLAYKTRRAFYVEGSGAYTWRGNVTLDRPAYFTDGRMYLSDQVAMPDVVDFAVRLGFHRGGLQVPISFSRQITRGGGDIRRQDMPFVSNRMNASKVDALVMYYLPALRSLGLRLGATYTVDGRNVGQATTVTAGLLYVFKL
jgi:hypothetical protein